MIIMILPAIFFSSPNIKVVSLNIFFFKNYSFKITRDGTFSYSAIVTTREKILPEFHPPLEKSARFIYFIHLQAPSVATILYCTGNIQRWQQQKLAKLLFFKNSCCRPSTTIAHLVCRSQCQSDQYPKQDCNGNWKKRGKTTEQTSLTRNPHLYNSRK